MRYFVYILASRPFGALYIGSTNDLRRRLDQHRSGGMPGHAARYGIRTLVWFHGFDSHGAALDQERRMKRWRRAWKEALITEHNPQWRDLTAEAPV